MGGGIYIVQRRPGEQARRSTPKINVDLKHQLVYPVLPEGCNTTLLDGSTLESLLDRWGVGIRDNLLAQLLAPPIAHLIVQGMFSTSLVLARCSHIEEVFEADIPTADWIYSVPHLHMQAASKNKSDNESKRNNKTKQRL